MLVVSKKHFYAIEAVLHIAYHGKRNPISGTAVAEALSLPTRYLEAMMQRLVRAGILKGMRGPQGGYMLGRERRRITLADIYAALAEKQNLPPSTTELGKKVLAPTAADALKQWQATLDAITIEQLCNRAQDANIPLAYATDTSFAI